MSELIFKRLDFDVQMMFTNPLSILEGIIVYIYATYRLMLSSNNKIKIEQWLFRFLFTVWYTIRRIKN